MKVRFADVASVDEAREELREVVEFLKTPKKYTNLGGKIPKGVLLVGPPGTGKTLLARAPSQAKPHVPFFSLSGSEFVERCSSASAPHASATCSSKPKPRHRASSSSTNSTRWARRVFQKPGRQPRRARADAQPVAGRDGRVRLTQGRHHHGRHQPSGGARPALLRPGRFDRQVLVDKPDVKGREEILRIHIRA